MDYNDDFVENGEVQGEGYKYVGPVTVDSSFEKKVSISEAPIGKTAPGKERHDLRVDLTDGSTTRRTSSVLTGYTKIALADGTYILDSEVASALSDYVSGLTEEQEIVCVRTGKMVSPPTFVEQVLEVTRKAGEIILTPTTAKVGIEAQDISIREEEKKEAEKRGVLFLGKKGARLPDGSYISLEELQVALRNYVLMEKEKEEIPPIIVPPVTPPKGKPEDEQTFDPPVTPPKGSSDDEEKLDPPVVPEKKGEDLVVVARKKTVDVKAIIALLFLAATMLLGLGRVTEAQLERIQSESTNLGYSVAHQLTEDEFETLGEAQQRVLSEVDLGESFPVDEGVQFHESSDYDSGGRNNTGTFGQESRPAGEYNVEGVSIIIDGQIYTYTFEDGVNVGDYVSQICEEKGVSIEDVTVRVHLGGPTSGWVDFDDLELTEDKTPQVVGHHITVDSSYKGTVEDFQGDTITITTSNGDVVIPVKDEDGHFLAPGSVVTVDGEEYRIGSLSPETIVTESEVVTGEKTKITYDVHRIADEHALLAAAIAATGLLGTALLSKKEEEDLEFESEEEFEKYREEFEKQSAFHRVTSEGKTIVVKPFVKVESLERVDGEVVDSVPEQGDYTPSDGRSM